MHERGLFSCSYAPNHFYIKLKKGKGIRLKEIIEANNLFRHYGKEPNLIKAIDGVSLNVQKGFTVITGASGSGKSTLLRLLGGLEDPSNGDVYVNNTQLSIFDSEQLAIFRRRNIGFVFRNHNLIPIFNVYENIIFPVELDDREVDREYIEQIVKLLNLDERLDALPHILSAGEKQRTAIARALATKPSIILADEPTGNLDSYTSMEVIGLLKMTSREFNQAVISITHDREIANLADRIVNLKDGKISNIEERRKTYEKTP